MLTLQRKECVSPGSSGLAYSTEQWRAMGHMFLWFPPLRLVDHFKFWASPGYSETTKQSEQWRKFPGFHGVAYSRFAQVVAWS